MSPVNARDLPASVRAQLGIKAQGQSRAGRTQDAGKNHPYKRAHCPFTTVGWTLAERHAIETGHSRVELVLEPRGTL